eukprot:Opistho-2@46289
MAALEEAEVLSKLHRIGLESAAKPAICELKRSELIEAFAFLLSRFDDSWAWSVDEHDDTYNCHTIMRLLRLLNLGHHVRQASEIEPDNKKMARTLLLILEKVEAKHGAALYRKKIIYKSRQSMAPSKAAPGTPKSKSLPRQQQVTPPPPVAAQQPSKVKRTPLKEATSVSSNAQPQQARSARVKKPVDISSLAPEEAAAAGDQVVFRTGKSLARTPPKPIAAVGTKGQENGHADAQTDNTQTNAGVDDNAVVQLVAPPTATPLSHVSAPSAAPLATDHPLTPTEGQQIPDDPSRTIIKSRKSTVAASASVPHIEAVAEANEQCASPFLAPPAKIEVPAVASASVASSSVAPISATHAPVAVAVSVAPAAVSAISVAPAKASVTTAALAPQLATTQHTACPPASVDVAECKVTTTAEVAQTAASIPAASVSVTAPLSVSVAEYDAIPEVVMEEGIGANPFAAKKRLARTPPSAKKAALDAAHTDAQIHPQPRPATNSHIPRPKSAAPVSSNLSGALLHAATTGTVSALDDRPINPAPAPTPVDSRRVVHALIANSYTDHGLSLKTNISSSAPAPVVLKAPTLALKASIIDGRQPLRASAASTSADTTASSVLSTTTTTTTTTT